ncbi:MAG TPA: putative toxin-antitoxin system toxin component, PIN family [Terriglobia bacterium]|nr:putative toxin-antitoxin system toxin component, PIN family [Terriglobia bacterium]
MLAWKRKRFRLVRCPEVLTELHKVAQRPFFRGRLWVSVAESLAASLYDLSDFYEELPSAATAPHPKDNFPLALADISQADFLITGDKGLLSLKQHKATRIASPSSLNEILETP